jgi:hypothetical protein
VAQLLEFDRVRREFQQQRYHHDEEGKEAMGNRVINGKNTNS